MAYGLEDGTNQLPQTTHTHHSFSQTHLQPITYSHSEPYREIKSEEIKEYTWKSSYDLLG